MLIYKARCVRTSHLVSSDKITRHLLSLVVLTSISCTNAPINFQCYVHSGVLLTGHNIAISVLLSVHGKCTIHSIVWILLAPAADNL